MMNIIHLVSNKVWGGGEQYVLDLCRRLKNDGHNVTAACRNTSVVMPRFSDNGINTVHLPLKGLIDVTSLIKLARIIKGYREGCIIHTHNFKDATTALRARRLANTPDVKILITRHLAKPASAGNCRTGNKTDGIIFVSDFAAETFMSTATGFDRSRIHVINNAIDFVPGTGAATERDGRIRLMYHGRIAPEKGIDTLIDALAATNIPDMRLTIAGTGDKKYIDLLKARASLAGTGRMIDWTGHVDDIHPLIDRCDIGIFPSSAKEAFGLSLIEYMAHGRPVISTDSGAQKEIITDGTDGFLIQPGNAQQLADRINRLATDPALRETMGRNARATFLARYTYKRFYNEILQLYADIYRATD